MAININIYTSSERVPFERISNKKQETNVTASIKIKVSKNERGDKLWNF